MDTLSPGVYPINSAISTGYQTLIQSDSAHPTTSIYDFEATSRTDLTTPVGDELNPGRGPIGSYIVLAAALPAPPSRYDGPICIRVSGKLRHAGTGLIVIDQADILKGLEPVYGSAPSPGAPRPIEGYRPAVGTRILAQAAGNPSGKESKAWVFIRWDAATQRWRRLAIGGYMTPG